MADLIVEKLSWGCDQCHRGGIAEISAGAGPVASMAAVAADHREISPNCPDGFGAGLRVDQRSAMPE